MVQEFWAGCTVLQAIAPAIWSPEICMPQTHGLALPMGMPMGSNVRMAEGTNTSTAMTFGDPPRCSALLAKQFARLSIDIHPSWGLVEGWHGVILD